MTTATAPSVETVFAPIAALTLPDSEALKSRASSALDFIRSFDVTDAESYQLAADELKAIKARANKLEDQRKSITGPINNALRAVNALFGGPGDILEEAERLLKGKMSAYIDEQERKAAEARKQAEEKARAEREALAAEAAAATQRAQQQQDLLAQAEASGDANAAQIAAGEVQRATAEASAAATQAQLVVAAPAAVVAAPQAAGISSSTKLDFEVFDFLQLVQHIAANPQLINLARPDEVRLRAYIKGVGTACSLPGVRVKTDRVISART